MQTELIEDEWALYISEEWRGGSVNGNAKSFIASLVWNTEWLNITLYNGNCICMESSCVGVEEERTAGTEMPRMHDAWCITPWRFTRSVFGFPHDRKGMSLVVLIPEGIMN